MTKACLYRFFLHQTQSKRDAYKSACFLRCVVEVSSAVIGSGAHVTVVAPVNNASGIHKAFMKYFINGIIAVQTNLMLHILEPSSSHVETLRSV